MINIKRVYIIVLNVLLIMLLSITSVFAWLTNEINDGEHHDSGRDIFLSSAELFYAHTVMSISKVDQNGNKSETISFQVDNNHSGNFVEDGDQGVWFKTADNSGNPSKINLNEYIYTAPNGEKRIKIEVTAKVLAQADINVRFKLIDKWLDREFKSTKTNDNYKWKFNEDLVQSTGSEFQYLDYMLSKDEKTFYDIPIVEHMVVTERQGASDVNNYFSQTLQKTLSLSLLITAVQSNRSDKVWTNDENSLAKIDLSFDGISNKPSTFMFENIIVDRKDLTTIDQSLANVLFKIKQYHPSGEFTETVDGIDKKYSEYYFLSHTRTKKDSLTLSTDYDYQIIIFVPNHMGIDYEQNQYNVITKITLKYDGNKTNWGFEDFIYAPKFIRFLEENTHSLGSNVIYYLNSGDENSGYYITYNNPGYTTGKPGGGFRLLGAPYDPNETYLVGSIIYHNNMFWYAKGYVSQNDEPRLSSTQWTPLGDIWVNGISKNRGDLVYTLSESTDSEGNRVYTKKWYLATNTTNAWQLEDYTPYKRISYEYDYINSTGKYQEGELLIQGDDYYVVSVSGHSSANNINNAPFVKGNYVGVYDPSRTNYSRGSIVSLDVEEEIDGNTVIVTRSYIWRNSATAPAGLAPNINPGNGSNGWHELTKQWRESNNYLYNLSFVREIIEHNEKQYYWKGLNKSNSSTPPGTARNGWQELSEDWAPYNDYVAGDLVIHDGAIWEAKINVPYDPVTGINVMPRNIGSFEVWEQLGLYDYGRN